MKHSECASYDSWMLLVASPGTGSGMPASAAGCVGELHGFTSCPADCSCSHSSFARPHAGGARNPRDGDNSDDDDDDDDALWKGCEGKSRATAAGSLPRPRPLLLSRSLLLTSEAFV